MPIIKDPLGREWNERKVGWVYANDATRLAEYRWTMKDGKRKLVYDMRRGMCDYRGRSVKEPCFRMWPVLYDDKSNSGWSYFPMDEESQQYMRTLSYTKPSNVVEDDADSVIVIK